MGRTLTSSIGKRVGLGAASVAGNGRGVVEGQCLCRCGPTSVGRMTRCPTGSWAAGISVSALALRFQQRQATFLAGQQDPRGSALDA